MTRADIILKVKARMDELSPFLVEELNPSIDLVEELLDESTISLLLFLPLYLLQPEVFVTTSLVETGRTGYIDLPTDFLRLYSFKMDGWDTEVIEAIGTQHPRYKLQKHSVTMGGVNKPVVVIKSVAANKVLYYYSLADGATHTVSESLYIKETLPENLTDDLTDFIAWQCASDVFLSIEETAASNAAKQKLVDLMALKTI